MTSDLTDIGTYPMMLLVRSKKAEGWSQPVAQDRAGLCRRIHSFNFECAWQSVFASWYSSYVAEAPNPVEYRGQRAVRTPYLFRKLDTSSPRSFEIRVCSFLAMSIHMIFRELSKFRTSLGISHRLRNTSSLPAPKPFTASRTSPSATCIRADPLTRRQRP